MIAIGWVVISIFLWYNWMINLVVL
jgi:hypothetical protein